MLFDFDCFSRVAKFVYKGGLYSLQEALDVFRYFFEAYERFTGEPHPPVNGEQIKSICQKMPFVSNPGPTPDLDPSIYPELIDRYFSTMFRNCNYRINHFFSGRIRELLLCEYNRGYGE